MKLLIDEHQAEVINWIKKHPEMHFMTGSPNIEELLSNLIQEYIRDGGTTLKIEKADSCWLVYFQNDWISELGVGQYFNTMMKYDVGKAGGCRAGIILNAFSQELVFYSNKGAYLIKGDVKKEMSFITPYTCCLSIRL
jgi:hypothetical protein